MSAYRFVAFPRGQQPTVEEVNLLTGYAPLLNKHVAWGLDRGCGALAVAFEADAFERAIASDMGFEALLRCWQMRGCTVVDSLDFVKDRDALHPVPTGSLPGLEHARHPAEAGGKSHALDHILIAKERLAQDALGRAKLAFERTMQRHESLRRFAAIVPYAMMVLTIVVLFAAGWYVTDRLSSGPRERRKDTIERIAEDAMSEDLDAGARDDESEPDAPPTDDDDLAPAATPAE